MENTTAFVLAGGRVDEMGMLTRCRAKAAVPFGGTYRVIDFPLSNLAMSGVSRVGVLSQYRPSSLMDHVGTGEAWGLIGRDREVRVLPPYQAETSVDWYRGTADAVAQNLSFAQDDEHVLIVSGDHIYRMDYRLMYDLHISTQASLTMVFKKFPMEIVSRYGVGVVDREGRVLSYTEKPRHPESELGSLTIFLFRRKVLERYLNTRRPPEGDFHLYQHVIPAMLEAGEPVRAFRHDAYWAYARHVDDYYQASLDVLNPDSGLRLDDWGISTNIEESGTGGAPPLRLGPAARVRNCRISSGCIIDGQVENSVLSPDVIVEEGAQVKDSVLLQGVVVRSGASLVRVISDKHVVFGRDCRVGSARSCAPSRFSPESQNRGVTVIGREATIPPSSRIGGNCQIAPRYLTDEPIMLDDGDCIDKEDAWNVPS